MSVSGALGDVLDVLPVLGQPAQASKRSDGFLFRDENQSGPSRQADVTGRARSGVSSRLRTPKKSLFALPFPPWLPGERSLQWNAPGYGGSAGTIEHDFKVRLPDTCGGSRFLQRIHDAEKPRDCKGGRVGGNAHAHGEHANQLAAPLKASHGEKGLADGLLHLGAQRG